jgi:hypothetical protein
MLIGGIVANQNESQNNARPPVNLSADPPWIGFPSTNWGASIGAAFSVRLDPQVNVRLDIVGPAEDERGRSSLMVMDRLTKEFAEWNDDLLGELAR